LTDWQLRECAKKVLFIGYLDLNSFQTLARFSILVIGNPVEVKFSMRLLINSSKVCKGICLAWVILIELFLLNQCNLTKLNNSCDPTNSSYFETLALKIAANDTSPFCGTRLVPNNLVISEYSIPSLGLKGFISNNSIVLAGDNITTLGDYVAVFTTNAVKITVNNVVQVSGATSNSYATPMKYVLEGSDGQTKIYDVQLVAPKLLGSGSLRLWLSADNLQLNDGDGVSSWNDISGFSNSIGMATVSQQPIFRANTLNGLPTLAFFNASDTRLIRNSGAVGLYVVNSGSFFAVLKITGTDALGTSLFNIHGQNGREFSLTHPGGVFLQCRNNQACHPISNQSAITGNFFSIGSIQNSNLIIREYRNGTLVGEDTTPVNLFDFSGGTDIGLFFISNGNLDMELSEILFFNNLISEEEIQKVFFYLNTKYKLI